MPLPWLIAATALAAVAAPDRKTGELTTSEGMSKLPNVPPSEEPTFIETSEKTLPAVAGAVATGEAATAPTLAAAGGGGIAAAAISGIGAGLGAGTVVSNFASAPNNFFGFLGEFVSESTDLIGNPHPKQRAFFVELGRRIEIARNLRKMNQKNCAAKAKISRTALRNLEEGNDTRLSTLLAVSDVLQIPIRALFEELQPDLEANFEKILKGERKR